MHANIKGSMNWFLVKWKKRIQRERERKLLFSATVPLSWFSAQLTSDSNKRSVSDTFNNKGETQTQTCENQKNAPRAKRGRLDRSPCVPKQYVALPVYV